MVHVSSKWATKKIFFQTECERELLNTTEATRRAPHLRRWLPIGHSSPLPIMKTSRTKILVVDDHFMVRLGLLAVLSSEPGFQIVGEARDGAGALAIFPRVQPDVTLMDGVLPDMHGVEVTRRIVQSSPDARIIILSINDTAEDVHLAMEAGAWGYIPKSSDEAETIRAIRTVASGAKFLPESLSHKLAERNTISSLSEREIAVLRFVADGMGNKEIARELGIGGASVKTYIARIFTKLGTHDRTQAVSIARDRGILRQHNLAPASE